MSSLLADALKARVKDTRAEPVLRWLVKRSRGIAMPFDLVKNEIYDRQAAEVMSRVLGRRSNGVDVGCHRGQFLRDFLRLAPEGEHWAFEPIPALAQELKRDFPAVRVVEAALSDASGEASFFIVPDAPARSGLHRRDFLGTASARREIKVRTEALDTLIPVATSIALVKIDVEGAEGLVMRGARRTLERCRPFVIFEHGRLSSLDFGVRPEEIYALLEQAGLHISLLSDWLAARAPLTRQAFLQAREWYFLAHP